MSELVLVLLKTTNCKFCHSLAKKWDKISKEIRKQYHTIKIIVMDSKDKNLNISGFKKWYPMLILVKQTEYERCNKDKTEFIYEKTAVLNGIWTDGKLKYVKKYDNSSVKDIIKFIEENENRI